MNESYSKKLTDPRWQRKRLEIFQRDNFTCQICGSIKNTLHVHHKIYEVDSDGEFKEPWSYDNKFLVTLCNYCHELEAKDLANAMFLLTQELKNNFLSSEIYEILVAIDSFQGNYSPKEISRNISLSLSKLRLDKL